MSRVSLRSAFAALLLVWSGSTALPAMAAGSPEPTSADPADSYVAAYDQAMGEGRFADALAAASAIKLDSGNSNGRAIVDAMRASALLGLKRESDARPLIAESDQLAPTMAEPSTILFFGSIISGNFRIAGETLDKMIARYPDAVRDLDQDLVRAFFVDAPKDEQLRNDDRRVALARLGYGGETATGHYYQQRAVQILVNKGDFAGASELLPYIHEPVALEGMLIQNRYAPLWPKIEELAGPHLSKARAALAAGARAEYEKAPDNHQALADYIDALRHAGRLKDAIALRSKLPATMSAMSSADEQMGWAVNAMGYSLYEAGRKDDADQLFAMLNDAPMPKEYWRVSMKINRLELLVSGGQPDKALPLIEPTAKTEGSAYAEQLVRRLRYCTLIQLGQAAEAEKNKPELLAHATDAPGPTIDALLCGKDADAAEKVALAALANPDPDKRADFEEDFVRQLQAHPLTSDDPSIWQGRWGEFRKRPAIAAAFARVGRDMPEDYLPEPAQ